MCIHNDGTVQTEVTLSYIWADSGQESIVLLLSDVTTTWRFTSRGGSPHSFTQSINIGLANVMTLIKSRFTWLVTLLGGRVISAERSVQLVSQVGK